MKPRFVALLLLTAATVSLHAQYVPEPLQNTGYDYSFGEWTGEDKAAVVFADVCNVRTTPDPQGAVAGKLTIGTPVQVTEVTGSFTQNGIKAPWVKVKAGALTGYVWGGLLTNDRLTLADGRIVVWGLTQGKGSEDEGMEYTGSVRVAQQGTVLDKHDFPVKHGSRPKDGYLDLYPAPELAGVKNLIIFNTLSEACGVYASSHYFLYTDRGLTFVGSGWSMGDGGMLHTSLEYAFPYPKPEELYGYYRFLPDPGHVLRIENNGSYDDNCDWDETYKVRDFKWEDGKLEKSCEY